VPACDGCSSCLAKSLLFHMLVRWRGPAGMTPDLLNVFSSLASHNAIANTTSTSLTSRACACVLWAAVNSAPRATDAQVDCRHRLKRLLQFVLIWLRAKSASPRDSSVGLICPGEPLGQNVASRRTPRSYEGLPLRRPVVAPLILATIAHS